MGQVRSIFLGQITNWKELGGPDRKINLFAGESTTGTLAFFQEAVLHVAAIGYGTLDANPGVRGVAIKSGLTSLAVEPAISTIRSREYPITRQVYWAIGPSASRDVKEFCGWVLSAEGQLIVEGAGFEPLLPAERRAGLTRLGLREAPGALASGR